jgi:hypothetical protein
MLYHRQSPESQRFIYRIRILGKRKSLDEMTKIVQLMNIFIIKKLTIYSINNF